MPVFDVSVNGRKLCRAGVGDDGVLNAIVTWVKLTGPAAANARRLKQPLEETRLHVGGLRDDTHRRWEGRDLGVGDRVTIDIVAARRFDPPLREEPRDPQLAERQERKYYERLKRKFEGPAARTRASARKKPDEDETRFLNVDLDIWSTSPLESLVAAFGKSVMVMHVGNEGRRHGAHLELAGSGRPNQRPDTLIRQWVALIKKLRPAARRQWSRAARRDFNIGIQAGTKPFSHELGLQRQTLAAIARVNANVVFTVYGVDSPHGPVR